MLPLSKVRFQGNPADRATHLKIVIAALTIGIAIVGSAKPFRLSSKPASLETTEEFNAGKRVTLNSSTVPITR